MRIIPYDGKEHLEDIESLSIMIKAVPFENGYAPAVVLISPSEDHIITVEEAACLMDGIEIANERVDELIAHIISGRIGSPLEDEEAYQMLEEDEENDYGESD